MPPWSGFTYVSFIVHVSSEQIVAWHASASKHTDLVMLPLRMALWGPRPRRVFHHGQRWAHSSFRCRVALRLLNFARDVV